MGIYATKINRLREGAVALITGASSGLGKQLALQYSKRGFRLFLTGRNKQRLQQTKQLCQSQGNSQIFIFVTDLQIEQNCKLLIDFILEKFNRIDIVLLNAGVNAHFTFSQMEDTKIYDQLMKINFYSNMYLTKYSLKAIKKVQGKIVVISSLSGKFGLPDRTAYCASKFALTGFFQSLRTQQSDIDIVLVYPTSLNTPMRENDLMGGMNKSHNSKNEQFDVKKCAQLIIKGVDNNQQDIYIPFKGHLGVYLQPFIPKILREKLKSASKL